MLACVVLAGDASAEAPRVVDRIVAVVDHDPLLFSDLVARSAPARRQATASGASQAALVEIYRVTLETMIDDRLVEGEARKQGILVTPEEVDRALDSMVSKLGLKSREELFAAATAQGIEPDAYRAVLRAQLLEYKLLGPALVAARGAITKSAVADRLAALRAKDPKATEADAEDALRDEAYAAARARMMAELRRAHYVEVRL